MKLPIHYFTISLIFSLTILYGQDIDASATLVAFGNGISTPCEQADDAIAAVSDRLQIKINQEIFSLLEFEIACNETNGFLEDIFQSIRQRLSGDVSSFFRFLSSLTLAPNFFQEAVADISSGITASNYLNDEDLRRQVDELYRPALDAGKKVIVIPHSQGNFYANEAFDLLSNVLNIDINHTFSIVSVANPSSSVAGDGPYTTLVEDVVIVAVTAVSLGAGLPSPLIPNTTNKDLPPCGNDGLCHKFIETYLNGSASGSRIIDHIVAAITATPAPEPEPRAFHEDFEGMVPIVRDSSTCHQDPEEYGYISAASIVSSVAASPTHSLSINNAIGGFCFGGFLGHLDTLSAYVRISSGATNTQVILVSQGNAAPARGCHVRFNSGSVEAYTADFQFVENLGSYSDDTFYPLAFVADTTAGTCRISWNSGPLSEPVASDTEGTFEYWSQLYVQTDPFVGIYLDDIVRNPGVNE